MVTRDAGRRPDEGAARGTRFATVGFISYLTVDSIESIQFE